MGDAMDAHVSLQDEDGALGGTCQDTAPPAEGGEVASQPAEFTARVERVPRLEAGLEELRSALDEMRTTLHQCQEDIRTTRQQVPRADEFRLLCEAVRGKVSAASFQDHLRPMMNRFRQQMLAFRTFVEGRTLIHQHEVNDAVKQVTAVQEDLEALRQSCNKTSQQIEVLESKVTENKQTLQVSLDAAQAQVKNSLDVTQATLATSDSTLRSLIRNVQKEVSKKADKVTEESVMQDATVRLQQVVQTATTELEALAASSLKKIQNTKADQVLGESSASASRRSERCSASALGSELPVPIIRDMDEHLARLKAEKKNAGAMEPSASELAPPLLLKRRRHSRGIAEFAAGHLQCA